MKRFLSYGLALLAVAVLLAVSCNGDKVRVIPRSKLARIYAEMFVTDQWIQSTPNIRTIADTSLVYEPILQKYGFTSEDYQLSVEHYMDDPERFSRILRTTSDILDKRIRELRKQAALQAEAREKSKRFDYGIDRSKLLFSVLPDAESKNWSDTLVFEWDSLDCCYRVRMAPRKDTVYEGVRMIVQMDTLSVDSLAVDSLAVVEVPVDSVKAPVPESKVMQPAKSLEDRIGRNAKHKFTGRASMAKDSMMIKKK